MSKLPSFIEVGGQPNVPALLRAWNGQNTDGLEPLIRPSSKKFKRSESLQPASVSTLGFSKDQKSERTCRVASREEEPPSRSASLGSQQLRTPHRTDGGKPQGKKGSRRGLGLLSAGCREVPRGEGGWSGGLSSHSGLIKKFPVHDPSGSSQGVSPMNPSPGFRLRLHSPGPSQFFF